MFICISYPLHALDKSLSSTINFNDVSSSPYIVGITYTNNDNITILDASPSPCVGRIPSALGRFEASFCRVELSQLHILNEV